MPDGQDSEVCSWPAKSSGDKGSEQRRDGQLEAIFGWEGGKMAALYTRTANREKLATGAMITLDRTENENAIPSPQGQVREAARKAE